MLYKNVPSQCVINCRKEMERKIRVIQTPKMIFFAWSLNTKDFKEMEKFEMQPIASGES